MICEFCHREHDGSYGSGRFCSEKCARSFSSNHFKESFKIAKCVQCGKEIKIPLKASEKKCKCDECKHTFIHKCEICGTEFKGSKHKKICENQFCQKHGIQQFKTLVKYFGFDPLKIGTKEAKNEFFRVRNNLEDLYWNQEKSSSEICKEFDYPNAANLVNKVFKFLEIPVKSVSYANKENILLGRKNFAEIANSQFKSGWHISWNGKKVYLRSSYEKDFARELDEKKIDYEVESLRIKYFDRKNQEFRCAIPDFFIPKEILIVEIKSSFTLDEENMRDKKKAYLDLGYKFKLICDHEELEI